MPEAKVYTIDGKESGNVSLVPGIFDVEVNLNCVRETLNQYQANQRIGCASTKTRSEVRGGGTKPWRQKGTGRARAGSIRSPLWVGGGVTFGPLPHGYRARVNKKKKRKAYKSAFTSFARENRVFILETAEFKEPSAKTLAQLLKSMGVEGKTLIILDKPEKNFYLSSRNIPHVEVAASENINIFDLVNNDNLVLTRTALKKLEESWS